MKETVTSLLPGSQRVTQRGRKGFSGIAVLCACLLALPEIALTAGAQATASGEWAWMGGTATIDYPTSGVVGVYGTLGSHAAANIPGSIENAQSWTDKSGNVWVFGGYAVGISGYSGYLNTLWEFNTSTNEWTWMGGSNTAGTTYCSYFGDCGQVGMYGTLGTPAAGNVPGGRSYASTWVDSNGNFWVFGGEGYDANGGYDLLNELWEYNPSSNLWTWVSGSSSVTRGGSNCNYGFCGAPGVYGTLGSSAAGSVPGGRLSASAWTDADGNLWLFGGGGFDSNGNSSNLNDLWEFSPSTSEWTWVGGSNVGNASGVYGELSQPGTGNVPGGRAPAANWTDADGNFWLFGGYATDASGAYGYLNDLWKFSPSSKEWTWVGGSSTVGTTDCGYYGICGQPADYGTLGVPAAGNVPGGHETGGGWVDGKGDLWLFGGNGLDATGTFGYLNDLWEFNPSSNEWTWIGGSSTVGSQNGGQSGVSGTLGVPAVGNVPGGRSGSATWTDSNGNFWLIGGFGYGTNGYLDQLNDVWEYQPPSLADAASLSDPAPGSTLGTSNVTFNWTTATGATEYQLWLGLSGPGSSSIYASGWLTTTSTTVASIPARGATVYARLYSMINGKVQYNDFTYTESPIPVGTPATMSSPAPNSVLGTSNVMFTWTAGTGATEYQLWLGLNGPGSSSLYASSWSAATSTAVPSLPAKGATVYARLYSMVNGKVQYNDYTFTESPAPTGTPAAMSSPAPGSVLGTSDVTFTWLAGSGATEYQLWLGLSGPGSSSLYTSGWLTTTSTTVTGIPSRGATVYARLYSMINGKVQYNDYTYTEQ